MRYYSKVSFIFSVLALIAYFSAFTSWQVEDGLTLKLTHFYKPVFLLFTATPGEMHLVFTSEGAYLNEEISIIVTFVFSAVFALASLACSALAFYKQENSLLPSVSLLLCNCVPALYSFKLGLLTLIVTGIFCYYLKSLTARKTPAKL